MSKKNKIQKQLLRAQIERNAQAMASGRPIEQIKNVNPAQVITSNTPVNMASNEAVIPKEATETALIRKDIRLSLILIGLVVVCLFVIYFIDRANPFLLSLANKIFQLISK